MSRELDARVAEVLGWRWDNAWGCLIPPEQTARPDEMWTDWEDDGVDTWCEPIKAHSVSGIVYNGNFTKIILPSYSEDWGAMQQVVQAVRCGTVEGHVAGVIEMTISDVILQSDCYCHIYGPSIAGGEAYANELPEAVALAFLAAMDK